MLDHNSSPHQAVDFIFKKGKEYAQARAERIYLEEFRKVKKALLINEALAMLEKGGTAQERESYAYSHKEYLEIIRGLKVAVEKEQALLYALKAAELRVEVWRSEQANNRRELTASNQT